MQKHSLSHPLTAQLTHRKQ